MVVGNKLQVGRQYVKIGLLVSGAIVLLVVIIAIITSSNSPLSSENEITPISEDPQRIPALNRMRDGELVKLASVQVADNQGRAYLEEGYQDISSPNDVGQYTKLFQKDIGNGQMRRVAFDMRKIRNPTSLEAFSVAYVKGFTSAPLEQVQLTLQTKKVLRFVFVSNDTTGLVVLSFVAHGTNIYIFNVNQSIPEGTNVESLKQQLMDDANSIVQSYDFPALTLDQVKEGQSLGLEQE